MTHLETIDDRVAASSIASIRQVSTVNKLEPTRYFSKLIPSPIGELKVVATDEGLAAILWANDKPRRVRLNNVIENDAHPVLLEAERQLAEYFAGTRTVFDLKLDAAGTEFQRRVWAALLTIPYGETRSYGEIAKQIGSPTAVRAVGAANGRNPISIVTPCHRVIGSTGKLTGFAGGLDVKAFLLSLEAPQPDLLDTFAASPAASARR